MCIWREEGVVLFDHLNMGNPMSSMYYVCIFVYACECVFFCVVMFPVDKGDMEDRI